MKLIRFGAPGHELPGIEVASGKRLDCSSFGEDWNEAFLGSQGLDRLSQWLKTQESTLPEIPSGSRLGSPIARPSKILCIGLNYRKHAEESGMPVPEAPILFMKASSSLCGPFDPIYIPRSSTQTDWEVELAVVIGKRAKYVTKENAYDYIAGYCVHNDVSERDFQLRQGGQWTKGKSSDHFAPLGPYMVTKDEIPDPHQLSIWLEVNGELLQNSNTGDLIFDIPTLISYVSNYMTLLPGDVISTGTPSGVGMGLKEPRYLKVGDRVRLGIAGLGESEQVAIQDPEA